MIRSPLQGLGVALEIADHGGEKGGGLGAGDGAMIEAEGQRQDAPRHYLSVAHHGPRWDHQRRMAKALALLDDPRLDRLITAEVAFADLPQALPGILAAKATRLATVVRYS